MAFDPEQFKKKKPAAASDESESDMSESESESAPAAKKGGKPNPFDAFAKKAPK